METTQDFRNFMEHISRDVKIRDGMIIGSIAELPIEYVVTRMETICVDTFQFSHDECAVLFGDTPPVGFSGTVFTVEPAHDRPGYARLRKPGSRVRYLSIDEMSTHHRSTMKRSNSYKEEILFDAQKMNKKLGKSNVKSDLNFFGLNFTKVNVQGTVTCLSWPREATEWRTRRRTHGWPAQDLLINIVNAGCHLVPFQGSANPHDSTVFRLSFARAEVALVYSWTPVQKYVYHILRLIKGDVVKQLELQGHRDIMRSYHFKTLMLWACETKPPEFWDESRVKLSVGELLCEMIEFLVDRNCPNYFMPSVNLMDHLPEDTDVDAVIMPLLIFKEQGAARLIATVPMADPHSRSTVQVSNKLMNLGQIGLKSAHKHAGYRRSVARFCEESSKIDLAYPMEFNSLFDGVSAHLRLASNAGCRQNDYEMAAVNFEQAMLGDVPAVVRRQISLGDALPDVFSSIFFADEKGDPSMHSGDGTRDTTSGSKGYTSSCHDAASTSRLDLSRQEASCTEMETAKDRAENGSAAKLSSVFHELGEFVLDKIEKQSPAEKKPLQSNLQLTLNITTTFIIPAFEYMLPKASSFVSASYRANFFYSHCHDYQLALYLCEESLRQFRSIGMDAAGTYLHDLCSVVLTPKWMPIFDQHIQAVYGFVALSNFLKGIAGRRRNPVEKVAGCRSTSAIDLCKAITTPHYLSPMEFIDYIKRQCETKLLPWPVNSGSGSSCSYRLFSHYGTVARRSRFILDAAFRISCAVDGTFTHNNYCGRSEPAWNPYSSRWCK